MANVQISALPEHTGLTTDGWFIYNNSGETTTSKSKITNLFYYNSTNSGIVASGDSSNINILLKPKGTGAIVADTSGNARGTNAVDFQLTRDSASKVASGEGTGAFGASNTVSGQYAFAHGFNNTASSYCTTSFGQQCQSTNLWAFSSGFNSIASGQQSTALGRVSFAAGDVSLSCGDEVYALGGKSFASGFGSRSHLSCSYAMGGRKQQDYGDNQYFRYVQSQHAAALASGATVDLSSEAYSGVLLDWDIRGTRANAVIQASLKWVAVCTATAGGGGDPIIGDTAGGELSFTMKNIAGVLTFVGAPVPVTTLHFQSDASMATALVSPVINANQLRTQFTAPGTTGTNTYKIIATVSVSTVGWS